jgi:PIN domain nuclease of toxin-antitoxin system
MEGAWQAACAAETMKRSELLLDTHFLLWITLGSKRLGDFPWIFDYLPWTISPVSLLEIQFLAEVGRIEGSGRAFEERISGDPRFLIDEVPLATLIRHSFELSWTRDPFDRLLAGHSAARRLPLCTSDRNLLVHHQPLAPELASERGR